MDLTLNEDQRLIASAAREFLGSRAASAGARSAAAEPDGFSAKLWKEMTELGWTGLALPESSGGVGEGFGELCLVLEELGRARVPSPLLATAACCGLPLLSHGTEAQKSEWLGAITRGTVMSYAAGGGVTFDGNVLDGEVPFVPYAGAAEHLLVTAGSRAVLSAPQIPVSRSNPSTWSGIRCSGCASLTCACPAPVSSATAPPTRLPPTGRPRPAPR
ncbi:MAG: acyl-CoA dehydrogenase family protein [Streptosporangiales bacterium]|nr:acyl-CoA dehydrogenase family protein [Streptosporangiales bacterium]